MRKTFLVAGLAIATLIPSIASAQATCEQRKANRVAGTVVGAGLGAILGSAIAGRGDRNEGAVIGALGGGLAGNQLSKSNGDCRHAYGYYDNDNQWHTNAIRQSDARGYYDRNGVWVDGAPSGRWDNGRYYANNASSYGYNASYGPTADMPRDIPQRISWLNERVRRGMNDGSLSRSEANRAMRDLNMVSRQARDMRRRNGGYNPRDEQFLQARLDTISSEIRWSRRN